METIKLQFPVKQGDEKITELKMRRPKVLDMMAANFKKTDAEKELRLFANICDVSDDVIGQLDMADYQALQAAYVAFLSSRQPMPGKPA